MTKPAESIYDESRIRRLNRIAVRKRREVERHNYAPYRQRLLLCILGKEEEEVSDHV